MSVNSKMTAIADAIRSKTGGTDVLTLDEMATAISGIEVGREPELQEKTVAPSTNSQTVTPDSGYDGLSKVTVNAMPTSTQATPSITVSSSGLITASATQTAGYVSAGTKSGTKQLTTQAAKTITPSKSSQTAVASGVYTTGAVTVGAIPSNYIIPSGTKTITANGTHDVKNYASATVNVAGEDVSAETNAYTSKLTILETAITQLETELQGKASGGSDSSGPTEFCNLQLTTDYASECMFAYKGENGWTAANPDPHGTATFRAECGSIVTVFQYGFRQAIVSDGEIVTYVTTSGFLYQVPNTTNTTVFIEVITE